MSFNEESLYHKKIKRVRQSTKNSSKIKRIRRLGANIPMKPERKENAERDGG